MVTELEIAKTRQGYRYRVIDRATKANVTTYTSQVRASALADVRAHLSDTAKFARSEDGLRALAQLMYNLIIRPIPEIEKFLREHNGPLFISTDDPEMPLELLHDGETFLGLRLPLGRGIIWGETLPEPQVTRQGPLSILIIADPTNDLPGARAEAMALIQALPSEVNFKLLQGEQATLVTVLRELAEGSHDIIHYAGHVGTDENRREKQAYLELGSPAGRILASEITNNLRGHPLVYLNGCRSGGRVEGAVGRYTENLARALIRGGALGLVGTLWDVPDLSAGTVSLHFYKELLAGQSVGEGLRLARLAAQHAHPDDATWASVIYYGDPTLVVPRRDSIVALKLDEGAQLVVDIATHEARKLNHTVVGSAHLFLAFSKNPAGPLPAALGKLGFSPDGLRRLVRQMLAPETPVYSTEVSDLGFTESVQRTVRISRVIAQRDQVGSVTERHLLVAFFTSGLGSVIKLLQQVGLDPAAVLAVLEGRAVSPVELAPAGDSLVSGETFGPDGRLNSARFDPGARQALLWATQEAAAARSILGGAHLLIGLLTAPGGPLATLVNQHGFDALVLADVLRQAQGYSHVAGQPPPPPLTAQTCSLRVQRTLVLADQLARREAAPAITERHILLAFLAEGGGSSAQILTRLGVNWEKIRLALALPGGAPQGLVASEAPAGPRSLLADYGRDLTEAARQGKLHPVHSRKREIEQVVHILTKETRNNPLLIGEAGVGKTAIIEALAQHIVNNQVPPILRNKRLIEITLGSLVAGTRYRGDFEERVQRLITEIRAAHDVVLFIDEIHTIMGAGDSSGNLDAANMFNPSLARGELHCIGATTPAEYHRTIAQDAALNRRFQPITVDELSPEDTLQILNATRGRYESRYGVRLTPESLAAAVRLSVRYMPERYLPDKAQSLIEEACARVSVGTMSQWEQLASEDTPEGSPRIVDESIIARIVAEYKHLPVEQLTVSEQEQLLKLDEHLKARVVGQDTAVTALARAVRLARTGLKDPHRPGGVFLFIGPTGVGKTELAKALASALFGTDDHLTRFDMSEFMEPHSVSKLIGAPPGYVGYREEGQLVRALRRKPYSVVLFDEIEKAAPNVFDLFLQLFDEGRLTDEFGQPIDGRHAIYIMTSNIGSELAGRARIGFAAANEQVGRDAFEQEVRERLRQAFRPEFLNRIDEILIFNRLTPDHIRAIALKHIDILRNRLHDEHGLDLDVTPEAIDLLCREGYVENMGARALQRAITQYLAAPLSDLLLTNARGTVIVRADGKQILLEMSAQN